MAGKTRPGLRYSSLIGVGLLAASACLNPQSDDLPSQALVDHPRNPEPAATGTTPAPGDNLMGEPNSAPTGTSVSGAPSAMAPSGSDNEGVSPPGDELGDAGAPVGDGGIEPGAENDPNVVP